MIANWFTATTAAEHDWEAALSGYWKRRADLGFPWQPDSNGGYIERAQAQADHAIAWARQSYRERILGWYRKLLLPMKIGDCVPERVSELLAEEWDERTRHR